MTTNTNATTNALGDTPPTVCPRCAGPCTLPGEGPTGQLGGLCTVCGWDYLVAADDVTDGGDPVTGTPDLDRLIVAGMANLPVVLGRAAHVQGVQLHALDDALGETGAALRILPSRALPSQPAPPHGRPPGTRLTWGSSPSRVALTNPRYQ